MLRAMLQLAWSERCQTFALQEAGRCLRVRFVLLLFYFLLSLLLEKEKAAPGQNSVVFELTFFASGLLS